MALSFKSSMNGFGTYREVSKLVVDVSWVGQRHAHALGSRFHTSAGIMSGHVFGAYKDIVSLIYQLNPDHLIFAYDRGYQWRRDIVSSYKEKRTPVSGKQDHINPSDDLERLFRHFPATHLSLDGFEADDVIGWYCGQHDGEDPLSIYTKDRDIWQLVSDASDITCFMPVKEKPRSRSKLAWVDEKAVQKDFGVPPNRIPMHKALFGDKSDSISGLVGGRKPGKKAALLDFVLSDQAEEYFDLSNTVPCLDGVPDFLSGPLLSERKRILENYRVANIQFAVDKMGDTDPLEKTQANLMGVMDVLVEFECDSLLAGVQPLFSHMESNGQQ